MFPLNMYALTMPPSQIVYFAYFPFHITHILELCKGAILSCPIDWREIFMKQSVSKHKLFNF